MRHRVFRQRSSGRMFESVVTVSAGRIEPAVFSVSAETHAQNIADAYGIAVDDVEVIEGEGEAPPPPGPVLTPLVLAPTPAEQAVRRLRAWVRNPADPGPTRQVVLDVLFLLKRDAL